MKRICYLLIACSICAVVAPVLHAEILFESGTLGPTGVSFADLGSAVPGTNVNQFVFPGVRFHLAQPAVTTEVGGHFVADTSGTFFGAIVSLDDGADFPDSANLSTPDVLGVATLTFPNPSAEVFGNLTLNLNPGWYALVFGSGLFETNGTGGAVRNGSDIADPTYIAYGPNLQWFNLEVLPLSFDNHRFVIKGEFVPEPGTLLMFIRYSCLYRISGAVEVELRFHYLISYEGSSCVHSLRPGQPYCRNSDSVTKSAAALNGRVLLASFASRGAKTAGCSLRLS